MMPFENEDLHVVIETCFFSNETMKTISFFIVNTTSLCKRFFFFVYPNQNLDDWFQHVLAIMTCTNDNTY